jgi:Holliday junction resolvase
MLESKIQTKIKKKLELNGFFVTKLIKTSTNGIPDLLAVKDGKATFIEVKRPDGVLSELQKLRIKELQRFGCEVKIWQDYEREFH